MNSTKYTYMHTVLIVSKSWSMLQNVYTMILNDTLQILQVSFKFYSSICEDLYIFIRLILYTEMPLLIRLLKTRKYISFFSTLLGLIESCRVRNYWCL